MPFSSSAAFTEKMPAPRPFGEKYREYLRLAEDARRMALSANRSEVRRSFEKIADGWQQLAEQVVQITKSQKPK